MAYLVRKPGTHLFRLLFVPVPIYCSLLMAFGYVWEPRYTFYNLLKAFFCLVGMFKAVDFAIRPDAMKRVVNFDHKKKDCRKLTDVGSPPEKEELEGTSFIYDVRESFNVMVSSRGLEYDWGQDVTVPRETRSLERAAFLRETFRNLVNGLLIIDFIDSAWKLFPPFQNETGGTIFVASLPWPTRYILSSVLHYSSGIMQRQLFQTFYDFFTFTGVLVLGQSPKVWPPIFDRPFQQDSDINFWAIGWHQTLRRTFFVCGGLPGQWIGEKIGLGGGTGLLFGTFFGSALYHEMPFYLLGLGFDWRAPAFFMQHACCIFLERVWKRVTGQRVAGWPGFLWMHLVMGALRENIYDSWHLRGGFGSSVIIPQAISPMKMFIFPVLSHLLTPLIHYFSH
ncbi:hypothetical protein BU17DRAFT_49801 [Hysterangium stoloniferum]|nr:hypothetical protein BU17DRAFT_49801 [Hysterangium stoloniferum]